MGVVVTWRKITRLVVQTGLMYGYYHFFTEYIYDIAICCGRSMEPTLYDKDLIIINKMNRYAVKKWDIVVIRSPDNPKKFLCKRVVHLPGEWVSCGPFSSKIQKGMVWLEGDNSGHSSDSRDYGPMPKSLIVGKPVLRIWPSVKSLKPDVLWEG